MKKILLLLVLLVMVKSASSNIIYDPVKILRHIKASLHLNIRIYQTKKRRGKQIIRMKLGAVRKSMIRHKTGNFLFKLNHSYNILLICCLSNSKKPLF
mgnify:CR=1 FL=1